MNNIVPIDLLPGKGAQVLDGKTRVTSEAQARETAEKFEAVFIAQMLSQMKMGIDPDGPMGGGQGEEGFRSVLNEEMGKVIADAGGFGIADAIYREILRMQES